MEEKDWAGSREPKKRLEEVGRDHNICVETSVKPVAKATPSLLKQKLADGLQRDWEGRWPDFLTCPPFPYPRWKNRISKPGSQECPSSLEGVEEGYRWPRKEYATQTMPESLGNPPAKSPISEQLLPNDPGKGQLASSGKSKSGNKDTEAKEDGFLERETSLAKGTFSHSIMRKRPSLKISQNYRAFKKTILRRPSFAKEVMDTLSKKTQSRIKAKGNAQSVDTSV
ncbi:hypothetical protein E2320_014482, partial [Naja naja]